MNGSDKKVTVVGDVRLAKRLNDDGDADVAADSECANGDFTGVQLSATVSAGVGAGAGDGGTTADLALEMLSCCATLVVVAIDEAISGAWIDSCCNLFRISLKFDVFCRTGGVGGQHDMLFLLRPPRNCFEGEEEATSSCCGEFDRGNETLFRKYLPGGLLGNDSSRSGTVRAESSLLFTWSMVS